MPKTIIKTSEAGWLKKLAESYKNETSILVVDDARVGIDPDSQSLFDMGRQAKLTGREVIAVGVGCGMTAAGITMVLLAYFDPEPTTKLGLLVLSGAAIAFTGGFSAIQTLTKKKPPRVILGPRGIEIDWD